MAASPWIRSLDYVFVNVAQRRRAWAVWKRRRKAIRWLTGASALSGTGTFNARFWDPAKQMPCQQPPWAELMAVNANTGDIAWRVPLGTSDEMEAKGIHNTGAFGQGGPIATAGGLVFIAGTNDKRFRAFDSRTGKVLWEVKTGCRRPYQPHDLSWAGMGSNMS